MATGAQSLARPVSRAARRDDWAIADRHASRCCWARCSYRDEVFRLTARYTLQSLAIAGLIYLAVARADRLPFRWLNARPLVYVGTISYTIYLSHHVILLGARQTLAAVELGRAGARGGRTDAGGRGADAPLGRAALRQAARPSASRTRSRAEQRTASARVGSP